MGNCCTCNCASPRSSVLKKGGPSKSESMMIKVVHSVERRVLELGGAAPMKVAELMLEFPGHFVAELEQVCQADGAQFAGCKRAAPLAADDEAKPGRVYVLLPMHRLHTRIAAQESASFAKLLHTTATPAPATKATKPQKHGLTSSKVTPLNTNCCDSLPQLAEDHPAINTEEHGSIHGASLHNVNCSPLQGDPQLVQQEEEEEDAVALSHQKHMMIMRSKTWVPKLETISESVPLTV